MRPHSIAALVAAGSVLTACAPREVAHVEVVPALCWHHHDYGGTIGAPNYHNITNYYSTNRYAPFVVAQGVPFTLDFSRHDAFTSPDTQRDEDYFDGEQVRMTVTLSNSTARFSGRCDYKLHEGITSNYAEDDESLYAHTLVSSSQRFVGTSSLGHEIRIHSTDDNFQQPALYISFRPTSAGTSKFNAQDFR